MISYIRGELAAVQEQKAIVGSGWNRIRNLYVAADIIHASGSGEEVKIHTYLNVREDAMQLYGFLTGEDLQVFRLLIGVSGIGPKGGLSILSKLTADDLRFAVLQAMQKQSLPLLGSGKRLRKK